MLCTSCKTKQTLQEYSMQSDSARTECSTTKEISNVENSTSSMMAACDTMSTSLVQEEFTIKFDSTGKPTEFHGTKQEWKKISKSEKSTSQEQQIKANKISCDNDFVMADIDHSNYKKIMKPEKKSSKNVLFSVILSLLTLIICHLVLKQKIKRKKLGA
jgi:hypothetical protein